MVMLKDIFKQKEHMQSISDGLKAGFKEQLLTGLTGSAKPLFLASLLDGRGKKSIIVTHKLMHAQQLYDDMNECMDSNNVFLYPVNELIASEMAISSPELMSERIHGLTSWLQSDNGTIIAPIAALKRKLPPLTYWEKYRLTLRVGSVVDIKDLLNSFVDMGYERVEMVTTHGEFSMRGGIIDIYTMTEQDPIRIELFDDEIDSIRTFDADTQRSLEEITSVQIMPATELLLTKENYLQAASRLEKNLSNTLKRMTSTENKEKLWQEINDDIEKLKQGTMFQGMYKYSDLFYENPASLLDYVSSNDLIILDELSRIQETAKFLDEEEAELIQSLLESNQIVSNVSLSYDWLSIKEKMNQQKIYMSLFLKHVTGTQPENIVNVSSHQMQEFHGQIDLFKNELLRWQSADYSVVILARNRNRLEKIKEILEDYDIETMTNNGDKLQIKQPIIITGNLSSGIELPTYKLVMITENELFKKQKTRVRKNTRISNAERIKHYQELNVGDYVVHRNHGIGKYIGIESMEIAGLQKDFLLIQYSGNDKLYVPTDQLNLIQKYVGSEGKEPRLFKLGGTEWTKVKRRVQSSVEDIADELIKLYAERQARKGHAFDKDNELQADFEQAFTYEETPDQLRSVEEIKADMEKPSPMDRLLCGDVGYGKTEVAIRAMFKAILEGKQVAVLVPTTILAQQHFQTMKERFQEYPIKIGLLSRFRSKKQQSETLDELKQGTVDIVIGTHRMLSKDVLFKDLGLLVVDEEQRFGVKHKERIKQIKTNVDVLTLTATPIPRTLHMSMLGIRDLSVIETPPENRFPIQTYVMEQNRTFIKEAIEREISRGGQVYLLYNRIQNIEKIAQEIERLVGDVRVSVAHGRMNENQLENVMFNFLEGESDVLVSTTIIETGVDIPNVNTLIVYDADRMGLSQLYQLRGRVGRSNRIAYAYFMYEKNKILTEVAEKRLQAIKEFTELGSGFKIAMRDLTIRGAGNLLGAEQHGFIDSVGFDLYSQMLKEAIQSKKTGQTLESVQPFNPEITVSLNAYIPDDYISDKQQKIDIYKRLQNIESEEEIEDIKSELIDRFGQFSQEVKNLLLIAKLKMIAVRQRVETINEAGKKVNLFIEEAQSYQIDGSKLFMMANSYGTLIQLGTKNNQLKVTFNFNNETLQEKLAIVSEFMEKLSEVKLSQEKIKSDV